MSFKYDGKLFYLTYSQFELDNDDLYNALCEIGEILWARVCQEHHQDGHLHSHVVGCFKERKQSTRKDFFDVNGKHPNIQIPRSVKHCLSYIDKEWNFKDYGPVPSTARVPTYDDIVEAAALGDRKLFLRRVHEGKMQYALSRDVWDAEQSDDVELDEYDERPIDFRLYAVPLDFKSLCIIGPPGIGKTGWAMKNCPRPCLFVKHLDVLRQFRKNWHKCIFFDDCDFKHLPRATQLALADYHNSVQIHVRYGVAKIPKGIPRLFACNPGCEPFILDDAIQERRVKYLYL